MEKIETVVAYINVIPGYISQLCVKFIYPIILLNYTVYTQLYNQFLRLKRFVGLGPTFYLFFHTFGRGVRVAVERTSAIYEFDGLNS